MTSIRVHGHVQEARLVKRVLPEYPKSPCEERVSGTVHLLVTVSKDGSIGDVRVDEGHPSLSHAAELAIKQWRYRPTLLNGSPVDVKTDVYVQFLSSVQRPGQ